MLLSYYGRRGTVRKRILPGEVEAPEDTFWARFARWIMAKPYAFLVAGIALLVAAAVPTFSSS